MKAIEIEKETQAFDFQLYKEEFKEILFLLKEKEK